MKFWDKIEYFFDQYGGIFKVLLIAAWLLWAFQLTGVLKKEIKREILYQKNRNIELEAKEAKEILFFADAKVNEAKALGLNYGADEYFKDLNEIDKFIIEKKLYNYNPVIPRRAIFSLLNLLRENIAKGTVVYSEISFCVGEMKQHLTGTSISREIFKKDLDSYIERNGVISFLLVLFGWCFIFYLRSIPLVFSYYLIRMSQRKGIFETILADKKRFFLAVFFWFIYFYKYPHNVVREIIVEAELRRIGNVFRKFAADEKELVIAVANSSNFASWIIGFHKENNNKFGRSISLALLAVIIMIIFFPCGNSFAEKRRGDSVLYIQSSELIRGSPCKSVESITQMNLFPPFFGIMDGKRFLSLFLVIEDVMEISNSFYEKIIVFLIEHVPIIPFYLRAYFLV